MPVAASAPTTEIGQLVQPGFGSVMPWQTFIDESEKTPELQWPRSPFVYELMLNDAQVEALTRGSTLPIRQYNWKIDPNGAAPEVVANIATSLGLPVLGEEDGPRPRRKGRFSHDKHLAHALRALWYGWYPFEQFGEVDVEGDKLWHLRKLAPRPPRFFAGGEIKVAKDGGLVYLKQEGYGTQPIPVDRLTVFVWEQEGANWVGRSMLRSIYGDWLIKDRLKRVNAINHERAGGIPYAEAPEGATPEQIQALNLMAQRFKVGEKAGGAFPHGTKLAFAAPKGNDTLASIKFHNEEMARAFLMMFMQGGQTGHGSRNMEAEFIDYHALTQRAMGGWYADVMTEHQIEDQVDWNFGPGTQAPRLTADELEDDATDEQSDAAADALVDEIDKGELEVDPEVEASIRMRSTRIRGKAQASISRKPSAPADGSERQGRPGVAAESSSVSPLMLPARALRRQPYDHEVQAQTNFAALDAQHQTHLDALVMEWKQVHHAQVDEIHDLIVDADGDLDALSKLDATPSGSSLVSARMENIAISGANEAMEEANRQGAELKLPDLAPVENSIKARAESLTNVMARSLSEAASRKALSLTGGTLSAADVAAEVASHLNNLSEVYVRDQFTGALTTAQNAGRKAVMRKNDPQSVYHSALLDSNTCKNCVAHDGTPYADMDSAEKDFPTGGYKDCQGGPRDRCTLVAVYESETPAEVEAPYALA